MINGIVFDLGGTLYLGEKAIHGAVETVNALYILTRVVVPGA